MSHCRAKFQNPPFFLLAQAAVADSFLFAGYSSCLHHAVDKSSSFIANDLIKTPRQTYATRPTYTGQQLHRKSILKRSHDYRHSISFFFWRKLFCQHLSVRHTQRQCCAESKALYKVPETVGPLLHLIASLIPCRK